MADLAEIGITFGKLKPRILKVDFSAYLIKIYFI